MRQLLLLICTALIALLTLGARAKRAPQQCTAIKVPTSTHLPVVVGGSRVPPPTELSAAFKPLLNTVELPEGYRAVGGGGDYVIACTE